MFSIVCGEGAISPDYFHHRLTLHEANLIMSGIKRRYRSTWETARWTTSYIAVIAGNEHYEPPTFWWEEDAELVAAPSLADIEELKRESSLFEQELNRNNTQLS